MSLFPVVEYQLYQGTHSKLILKSFRVRLFYQEPTLLKQIIEELYAFVDFFEEIKSYEVLKGSSFVQKFDDLINDINSFIADFQLLVSY